MSNTLILCGGTGAHIALAFARLHTLGSLLGFFLDARNAPLAFPTLYLVDQDSGPGGVNVETAWQKVGMLLRQHPARYSWRATAGVDQTPEPKVVTPLPVGQGLDWFRPPNESMHARFGASPFLELLATPEQQDIEFSKGMMGSPAVGSLLFRLKAFDRRANLLNYDKMFADLFELIGRVVVAGSGVGGTGAAVGPTLARRLASTGHTSVMAVMLLNWFRFDLQDNAGDIGDRAQDRNRVMLENANSAFQYYGREISSQLATVPVGIPDSALTTRRYTSDTTQPVHESFAHAVAALCCFRHFLRAEPYGPGLYQMGAEDPFRLGGGNSIPSGTHPGGTLQSLSNRAQTLADTLGVFVQVLQAGHGSSRVMPAVYEEVTKLAEPRQVAAALETEIARFREHLQWMRVTLGIEPHPYTAFFTRESLSRQRLVNQQRPITDKSGRVPEEVALALFHWAAAWVREKSNVENGLVVNANPVARGGYWPKLVGEGGLNAEVESPGELTRVPDQKIPAIIKAFVHRDLISENGWPDPLAAVDYFRDAVEHGDRKATRQLQMLTVGVIQGFVTVRELPPLDEQSPQVSLESLIREYRTSGSGKGERGCPGVASIALVYTKRGRETVIGFNSPHTLFCAVPFNESDETAKQLWGDLWMDLTGADPKGWQTQEAPVRWKNADNAIRVAKGWRAALLRLFLPDGQPPWMRALDDLPSTAGPLPFGTGIPVQFFWGEVVREIEIPTADSAVYRPAPETPVLAEADLLKIEELWKVSDGGEQFERVTFTIPAQSPVGPDGGPEVTMQGIWKEHLEILQKRGIVYAFGADRASAHVFIATAAKNGTLQATTLTGTWLLDRMAMMADGITPMTQDPVSPYSRRHVGEALYPDLPIRWEYLDLVLTDTGRPLLDVLKKGDIDDIPRLRPEIQERNGKRVAEWTLRLRGRQHSRPFPQVLSDKPLEAHWMVWPNFRHVAPDADGSTALPTTDGAWRAYYVYEYCLSTRLHVDALWLDPETRAATLTRFVPPNATGKEKASFGARPVAFHAGGPGDRMHVGGPPLALCLRDVESQREHGIYLVRLRRLNRLHQDVNVGIDFGTSHTVAAFQQGDRKYGVELGPQLGLTDEKASLVLHVSENRKHVDAPFAEAGLLASGVWLPTYTRTTSPDANGLLPSELLAIDPLAKLSARDIASWQPGRDYVIPPMEMGRHDLADYLLADFKWEASFQALRRQEPILREIYLGMVTELVMAEVVSRLGGFPSGPVRFTFTYPLRISSTEFTSFTQTLGNVLSNGTRSIGCRLELLDEGTFDESRAAQAGTESFGDVSVVGDLGGGTLDLFISAEKLPDGLTFAEVADSARLGGNMLLQKFAQDPQRYLPREGRWNTESPEDCQTQLRAWMRSKGSAALFGPNAGTSPRFDGLDLQGFTHPAQGEKARDLINRYFRILVEYMARSLVAYLAKHWYPQVKADQHGRLKIHLHLRGNGWRLWPESENYGVIEREIGRRLQERVATLWQELDAVPADVPTRWPSSGHDQQNPKAAPIMQAVGKSMSNSKVRESWHSYTLVELDVIDANQRSRKVPWFERLPFLTGGNGTKVELDRIVPPLPLTSPGASQQLALSELEGPLKRRVNGALQRERVLRDEGTKFDAPVAPLVWEAAFDSAEFRVVK